MIKKILLGMTTLSCVALASQDTNLYLKTGADIWQKFDVITPRDSETINRKKADMCFASELIMFCHLNLKQNPL